MSLFLLPNVSIWNVRETRLRAFDLAFDTYRDFLCFHSHNFIAIKENSMKKNDCIKFITFLTFFSFSQQLFFPSFIISLSDDVHRETLQKQFLNNGLIEHFFYRNKSIDCNERKIRFMCANCCDLLALYERIKCETSAMRAYWQLKVCKLLHYLPYILGKLWQTHVKYP